jgi:hypothetical protein
MKINHKGKIAFKIIIIAELLLAVLKVDGRIDFQWG